MYRVQIRTEGGWRFMAPTGSDVPYMYRTRKAAEGFARMCYPDAIREQGLGGGVTVRVVGHEEGGS